jgi:hypothetical protein
MAGIRKIRGEIICLRFFRCSRAVGWVTVGAACKRSGNGTHVSMGACRRGRKLSHPAVRRLAFVVHLAGVAPVRAADLLLLLIRHLEQKALRMLRLLALGEFKGSPLSSPGEFWRRTTG